MPVKVQKKDGRMEDFDRNKVLNGVVKSGATLEQAEEVVRQVEAWLSTVTSGVVSSMGIRTKVLEVLRSLNPTAAAAFENYRKPAEAPGDWAPPQGGEQQPPSAPPTGSFA